MFSVLHVKNHITFNHETNYFRVAIELTFYLNYKETTNKLLGTTWYKCHLVILANKV